jgi:ATP-binding cassette subfamily G (WHITE) protein 2 (SNQ2)
VQDHRHPPVRDILNGFEGSLQPGEMLRKYAPIHLLARLDVRITVVLGRPGAGCTTLLKTLANHRSEYHAVHGSVPYDSLSSTQMATSHRGDLLFVPEDDVHFPTLTVRQTLAFAARTRCPRTLPPGQSGAEYVQETVEMLERAFGLSGVSGTQVGDNRIRGVSGGEKKRVSLAEALASRPRFCSWDKCVLPRH